MQKLRRKLISLLLLLMLTGYIAITGGERAVPECKAATCCDTCLTLYFDCIENGLNPNACQLRYNNCAAACGGCE